MRKIHSFTTFALVLGSSLLFATSVFANLPGGGTGTGANVTLTDNGTTVTLANGIVSILCTKSGATINQINYTFNNTGSAQTLQLLSGGNNGGQLYWENSSSQALTFSNYTVVANPANNGGGYAEISLSTMSVANDALEVHFSMARGNTGFYVTAIWYHRSIDGAFGMGECRDNIYAGSIFNWMSVDANRNRLMEVSGGSAIAVQGAPPEVSLWTNGIYAGRYEDKYKYSADFGVQRAWGWSSVGAGGKNVGLWNVIPSAEFYNGGPMKRELMSHIGTTILNMLNGGHYGGGADGNWAAGEVWTKVDGPYFIYCNNITNTISATNAAAQALYNDALAQAAAEATAWPYSWFTNANYANASGRGTVTGQIIIADSYNPNASASNLWVGVIQQPVTVTGTYDFQEWMKPYQFWVKTDANGNFAIPNVIAGTNYTLYAFGPGAAGTFQSQPQVGGSAPNELDIPATPFSVAVTASVTNNLSSVIWTPLRVGPTVFEIGYPDRTAAKFRHGEDYWVGDIGPSATAPSPVWSKWLEYPFDFPSGPNYVVGQSRWSTDWNFVQPVVTDSFGNYNGSTSTIVFNLPSAPTNNGSFFIGTASSYQGPLIIQFNGNDVTLANLYTNGYNPNYDSSANESDATIREGIHGIFDDNRLVVAANYLRAGQNTITINMRKGGYFANHSMYDYIRFELPGYVPPAPVSATAYAGNNANLICWPVQPGATSYNLLRSMTSGSGYVSITNGVTGPACGSGFNNATYLDTTATNGTTYYYVVRSVNPVGSSTNSPPSLGATPSPVLSTSAPASVPSLWVGSVGHHSVTLNWSAPPGANYYTIYRSTLFNNGGGASNVLNMIVLANNVTNATYTDTSPTDGSLYQYVVTATAAGGTSANSPAAAAVPLPVAPASAPASLAGNFVYTTATNNSVITTTGTNIVLNWSAVSGAVGYIVSRATSSGGPYTYLQTVTETTYTDYGLNAALTYYYRVSAMNGAGLSAYVAGSFNSQPPPASLTAFGTNAQIILSWPAANGANGYSVKRGVSSGNETTTVVTGYAGTTYTNSGLVNGTTYYYVVTATGAAGTSVNSPEASATPFATSSGIWTSTMNGIWGAATNWSGGGIANGSGNVADFSTLSLSGNLLVTLDAPRVISGLKFGDITSTYNWSLIGTNTLTLGISPSINVVNQSATISVPLAGTNGLNKLSSGLLTLGGATNTFTGGMIVNAGTLALDYTASGSPGNNLIPATNALTLNGSGLQIYGGSNAVSSQTFASTTFNAGVSVVAGVNNPAVNLGAVTANTAGLVKFIGPATVGLGGGNVASTANVTTTVLGSSAFVGGNGAAFYDANYATVGLYDYAATVGSAPLYSVVGGSQIAGFYTTASGTAPAAGNLDVTGNITAYSSQPYITSFRFNTPIGSNVTVFNSPTYSTVTLADILVTPNVGAYNVIFSSSNLRPAGGSLSYAGPYVVWQNNSAGELIINSTLGNSKVGAAAYVQAGPGTVWINNNSSGYTNQSYLNGGYTLINGNGSIGAPAYGLTVNLNGGTLVANNTFALDNGGSALRPVYVLSNGGGLTAATGNILTVDGVVGSPLGAGPLTIGIAALSANNNTLGLLPGTGNGTANPTPVYGGGTVVLNNANYYTGGTILQSGTLNFNGLYALGGSNYGGITFNGGTLQYAANFPGTNGPADLTAIGTAGVTVTAGGGVIDLNGNAVTYTNSIGNNGNGGLTVISSLPGGSLTLLNANAYAGNTLVTNAALVINNGSGSGTGFGDVFVQGGGILSGIGLVTGSISVAPGGTLMPGNPLGILSIGNSLTLAAGSTTWLQVQHSPFTNDAVNIGGTLTEGGTLVVTNSGGALANGDIFNLLNASSYAASFAAISLPPLTGNLVWNTNLLVSAGVLSVVAPLPPLISSIQVNGSSLTINGSGGINAWPYLLLVTTNLAAPNWQPVASGQFDASGNFSIAVTNGINPAQSQTFFKLQLQ